jgi:hypothetical protein
VSCGMPSISAISTVVKPATRLSSRASRCEGLSTAKTACNSSHVSQIARTSGLVEVAIRSTTPSGNESIERIWISAARRRCIRNRLRAI